MNERYEIPILLEVSVYRQVLLRMATRGRYSGVAYVRLGCDSGHSPTPAAFSPAGPGAFSMKGTLA